MPILLGFWLHFWSFFLHFKPPCTFRAKICQKIGSKLGKMTKNGTKIQKRNFLCLIFIKSWFCNAQKIAYISHCANYITEVQTPIGITMVALDHLPIPNQVAHNLNGWKIMPKVEEIETQNTTEPLKMTTEKLMSSSGRRIQFSMSRYPSCCQDWNRLKKPCMNHAHIVITIQNPMASIRILSPDLVGVLETPMELVAKLNKLKTSLAPGIGKFTWKHILERFRELN